MLEKMAANRERLVLLASSVLTTATLLLLVVVIPLAAVHMQKRNTQLLSNVYDCQIESRSLWKQVTQWDKSKQRRAKRASFFGSCCSCRQGPPGPQGKAGKDGVDGKPGGSGEDGRPGRSGSYLRPEELAQEPCQKCPPSRVGHRKAKSAREECPALGDATDRPV
ncbi:hypothetical protein M3Y99_01792800 [Aphelenchoides fujianensis]|nr:hypothetical protein M3Y99_01792800 [Aphelenchoides fujianensis]